MVQSTWIWFIIDSGGSIVTGIPLNALSNITFLVEEFFAWFSFKAQFVRLYVLPLGLTANKKELKKYDKTKAIVCFPISNPIPKQLVKKIVKSSLKEMMRLKV